MSKSILIIDTPEDCEDCPLSYRHLDGDWGTACAYYWRRVYKDKECPLKELPELRQEADVMPFEPDYNIGWNDCLRAIEGGDDK